MQENFPRKRVWKCGRGETRIVRRVAKGVDHKIHAKRGLEITQMMRKETMCRRVMKCVGEVL